MSEKFGQHAKSGKWFSLAAGAAISALAVSRAFIELSGLDINAIAKAVFAQYDSWLRAATFWVAHLIFFANYLFSLHLSLPDGWHTIFAVMMLKPIADAAVDGRPGEPRYLTRAYFLVSGLPISLAFAIFGASGPTEGLRPILAIVCGLSLYELFKSIVMGSIYIPRAIHTKYGKDARKKNILYYLCWYTGGFSALGALAVGAAWQWARDGRPSPSALGSIVYLILLTLYHLILAVQAYLNDRRDFEHGFRSEPAPPFVRLVRTKWFIRLAMTLLLAAIGILAAIAET